MKRQVIFALVASAALAVAVGFLSAPGRAAGDTAAPPVVADGLSGVVTGAKGPEAGVWVIAEAADLPTRFIKIVVTDDLGRFVVPDLPKAKYKVWVRGYGLVDSPQVDAAPGQQLTLKAVPAPNAKAAAEYYPANYWLALVKPPAASEFPGTGDKGNGIATTVKSQQQWLATMKVCIACHQIGDQLTREPAENTAEAWGQRIQMQRDPGDSVMGNKGAGYALIMKIVADQFGHDRAMKMYADWSGRIAKGALPTKIPPRPTGVERNLVITQWDVGKGTFVHDNVSSDRRDPNVNAKGPVIGIESHIGKLVVFNPTTLAQEEVVLPTADMSFPHSITMDGKGRAWVVDFGYVFQPGYQPKAEPGYCSDGNVNKFASYFPNPPKENKLFVYDPKTKKVTNIPTCFRSQHQWFDTDKNNTMYTAGDSVIGWIDTVVWDKTHDAQKATGWCPMVIDTKTKDPKAPQGDKNVTILTDRAQWNELGKSSDPSKDTRIPFETYGLAINTIDHSVWFGITDYHGGIVRFERGANAPETCKAEYYLPPKLPDGTYAAFTPHDVGIDSKGIAWVTFTSGQVGRFDRSKCKVLSGPTATGDHCPEGWTIYDDPNSPRITGTKLNADFYYQMYVDQHDVFGLGKDIPLVPAANSDAIVALMPDTGKYVTFRIPYPRGYFGRWIDARVDDPKAGWKGRGVWTNFSTVPVWHQEGGLEGAGPEYVKFQLRPDPLAH